MVQKTVLEGPFAEAREWLISFANGVNVKNETLLTPLASDWTHISKARAAYVLGVVWGRLRQMNSSLEQAVEYANLVNAELDDDDTNKE